MALRAFKAFLRRGAAFAEMTVDSSLGYPSALLSRPRRLPMNSDSDLAL